MENQHVFAPTKVVSQEEFDKIFADYDGLEVGETITPSIDNFLKFVELWVSRMDHYLEKAYRDGNKKAAKDLFYRRAFTYNEFKLLFKEIQEEKFKLYPVFKFLRVPSVDFLVEYRLGLEETPECYFQVLLEAADDWDRNGIGFFLRRLKTKIPIWELKRHCYICGATGSGKSELMRLLFYGLEKQSRKKEHSLVLIDPHGDLSQQIKNSKLHKNSDRLIYLEPELKKGWTPVINPLDITTRNENSIVTYAQNLSDAIEEAVGVDMTVNMGALLIPCLSLLLRKPNTTLLDLIRLMKDDQELIKEGQKLHNKAHRLMFENFQDRHYVKSKTSIFTKLQSFLNYPAFYNMVIGKSTVNIGKALDSGKILVLNISDRYFGPDASQAFGRFVISLIKSHAKNRGKFRKPTFIFIDECQNFISPSIENILEQTRKFGLYIIMANQSVERLGSIESIVLGNTSVKLIGANDSIQTMKKMSTITGTDVSVFQNLRNYSFYLKTRDSKGEVFKASDVLIKDNSLSISQKDEWKLNDKQVSQYYKKIEVDELPKEDNQQKPKFDL